MANPAGRQAVGPEQPGRPRSGRTAGRAVVSTALMAILGPAVAWAQNFKSAPKAAEEGGGGGAADGPDTILGLVHVNTAFFIAIGVIAAYWFLFGGGRKANIGRKE